MSAVPPAAIPFSDRTLDPSEVDALAVATSWISDFNEFVQCGTLGAGDVRALFVSSVAPWWQDHLALTWDIRTFSSVESILRVLQYYALDQHRLGPLKLQKATLAPMADNLLIVQAVCAFESPVLTGSAVVKLVSDKDLKWKAWTVFTKMEELRGFESDLSRLASPDPSNGDTVDVLVVGAGQIQVAAAVRTLGLTCLLVEQRDRIGDHWRQHYRRLKLHLTKWYCQFGYCPYPPDTSVFPTRDEVADQLEYFVKATHLNVITSATVSNAKYDPAGLWDVMISRGDGTTRNIKARHIVLATGINGLKPLSPSIPMREAYKGTVMHSINYKDAEGWSGKRAIVVGVGNTGHDIAHDLYDVGAVVTMTQRNPTMVTHQITTLAVQARTYCKEFPVETADLIMESTPLHVARVLATIPPKALNQDVVALNKALAQAGFRLKTPDRVSFIYERFGGHYLNSGTSSLIADGKVAIKSGVPIKSFTAKGLEFDDGCDLPADLIVFATGYDLQSMRQTALEIMGEEEGKTLKEMWGLDEEGNVRGAYRDSGHERFWYFGGDFQGARYFAKIVALQIKAEELGMLSRYKDVAA